MKLLKMIILIGLRLLGMTSVMISATYSPEVLTRYLSSAKATAMIALPFCVNFFSDLCKSVFISVQQAESINLAVGSAILLTVLIAIISLGVNRLKLAKTG